MNELRPVKTYSDLSIISLIDQTKYVVKKILPTLKMFSL